MPYLELTMPESEKQLKEQLSGELTKEFCRVLNFPPEIFGIVFREYGAEGSAQGGTLWTGDENPYVTMLFHGPRISRNTKEKLISSFTSAFIKVTKKDTAPVIIIFEHPFDNIGVCGKSLTASNPALKEKKHYYSLADEE